MPSILEQAWAVLQDQALCDECLGRQFAKRGHGFSNAQRGQALRVALCLQHDAQLPEPELCPLCMNHFHHVPAWAERAYQALLPYEFERYLMGTRPPGFLEDAERQLRQRQGLDAAEPLKQGFNRAVGKQFGELIQTRQGRPTRVDFQHPEVTVYVDLIWEKLSVQINPLYVFGRYCKLVRGIPQTRWPCTVCKGRGCAQCGGSGQQYPQSVESLIGEPLRALCQGQDCILHGAGREDIDARMLGAGRPFVLEVKQPVKRFFDWAQVAEHINQAAQGKASVLDLRPVNGAAVGTIKEQEAHKRYRAQLVLGQPICERVFQLALQSLVGPIRQRTPQRVSHRRADLWRQREVFSIQGRLIGERSAEVEVHCSGGLYVKELISGDEGRTQPSLAGALGTGASVSELDVIEVAGSFL